MSFETSGHPRANARIAGEPRQICCSRCKKPIDVPRQLTFFRTYSLVLCTFKRPQQGIFCTTCARREGRISSFITSITGWWSFPFGPFSTLQSLVTNLRGGKQNKADNSALLLQNAEYFQQRGYRQRAYDLARLSRAMDAKETTGWADRILKQLEKKGVVKNNLADMNPWAKSSLTSKLISLASGLTIPVMLALGFLYLLIEIDSLYAPAPGDVAAPKLAASSLPSDRLCATLPKNGQVLTNVALYPKPLHGLQIKNGNGPHAIVKIREKASKALIASFFVRSNQTASIGGIPDGDYVVQYAFGWDFDKTCKSLAEATVIGEFDEPISYKATRAGDKNTIAVHSLSLYREIGHSRLRTRISAQDFNHVP